MPLNLPVKNGNHEPPPNIIILSTTSDQSRITHVSPDFVEISGFTVEEPLGQPHNIVRHPYMPPAAFQNMWNPLKAGCSWMGLVKNRCKNGDHYWVSAYVTKHGSTIEYQSVRTKPEPEHVKAAEKVYSKLRDGKSLSRRWTMGLSPKLIMSVWVSTLIIMVELNLTTIVPFFDLILVTITSGLLISVAITLLLFPTKRLVKMRGNISKDALIQFLYTERSDEFGEIEFALKIVQAEIDFVIGRIDDASSQISKYIGSLLNDMELSKTLINKQQPGTDQIATAITQVTASIQDGANNSQRAADAASKSYEERLLGRSNSGLQAHLSVSLPQQVADALTDIVLSEHKIVEMNIQIATTVEQQEAFSQDINVSIKHVHDTAIDSVKIARNNSKSVILVARLSNALSELAW